MQPVLRFTWTGLAASCHQYFCICSTRFSVSSPSYRRLQSQPRHPAMELVRPIKQQRIAAFVPDADSPAVLSEETESIQKPAKVVSTSGTESPARKVKVLLVPNLIQPGPLPEESDLWGCSALLVDKPQTWTSFDVCGKLKGVLRVKKIGHAGTLDPMATGLLIICTGKATKSIDSFQAMHKEYSEIVLQVPPSQSDLIDACVVLSLVEAECCTDTYQISFRRTKTVNVTAKAFLDDCCQELPSAMAADCTPHTIHVVPNTSNKDGTMRLGEATNSYDADGDITETLPWQNVTLESLQQKAHMSFVGDLQQIPPMFSALRVKGKRLYESAREGKVVERAARSVHVSQFDLTQDPTDPQQVHFYISCSKGTYIRSLAHDLGQAVGTAAHLVALRREAIGKYNVKDAWTLEQLQAAVTELKEKKARGKAADAALMPINDAASTPSNDGNSSSVQHDKATAPDSAPDK